MSGNGISMSGTEYDNYIAENASTSGGTTGPFSEASSYREFLGNARHEISDAPLIELGITIETIKACVFPDKKL